MIDRPKLTADEWQLYTSKPNAARVARSLNAAALRTFKAIEKATIYSPASPCATASTRSVGGSCELRGGGKTPRSGA